MSFLNSPSARSLEKIDVSLEPLQCWRANAKLSNLSWSSSARKLKHLELEMRKVNRPRFSLAWIVAKIGLAADRLEFLRIYDNDPEEAEVHH